MSLGPSTAWILIPLQLGQNHPQLCYCWYYSPPHHPSPLLHNTLCTDHMSIRTALLIMTPIDQQTSTPEFLPLPCPALQPPVQRQSPPHPHQIFHPFTFSDHFLCNSFIINFPKQPTFAVLYYTVQKSTL